MNLAPYLPVILFILVGVAVGVAPQVLGFLFGPHRPDAWYGFSLGIMLLALVLRYADRWMRLKQPVPQA